MSAPHDELDELVDRIHLDVLDRADRSADDALIVELIGRHAPLLSAERRDEARRRVRARVEGLGRLEPLLADPTVSEVMINGPGPIWVERDGSVGATDLVLGRDEIDLMVERIVAPIGRRVDRRSPWVDGRLHDGSRVNVIVPPVALDGPYITIRRFVLHRLELSAFTTPAVAALILDAVDAGANIVVSGGTGAGKTTLLNAVGSCIDPGARIVTVEDAAELQLPHPHVVRLESRPATSEGVGEVVVRDLVRNALRMRPDRLVVGEVRGAEALDLVQALNTGHAGCLSTVHANGAFDALQRLLTLTLLAGSGLPADAVAAQIAAAVDLVVHVGRGAGGRRRIVEVGEVVAPGEIRALAVGDAVIAAPSFAPRSAP